MTVSSFREPRVIDTVPSMNDAATPDRFEEKVLRLLPDLYATALGMLENEADAEDLVAETVARAWSALGDLESEDRFRGWIFRILTNACIDRYRSRAARPDPVAYTEDPEESDVSFSLFERLHQPFLLWGGGNPEQKFLNRLLREDLRDAVRSLPLDYRVVVVLADVEGLSYREIADALEVPIGTVRSRLSRGRARLQKALWSHAVEAGLREDETPTGTSE